MSDLSPFACAGHASPQGRCSHVLTAACPVDCLRAVLCTATFHVLARAEGAPFGPPTTVGQAVDLWRAGRLGLIAGLGRRRLGEIDVAFVVAGFACRDVQPP
jgi:hypothetical protein